MFETFLLEFSVAITAILFIVVEAHRSAKKFENFTLEDAALN